MENSYRKFMTDMKKKLTVKFPFLSASQIKNRCHDQWTSFRYKSDLGDENVLSVTNSRSTSKSRKKRRTTKMEVVKIIKSGSSKKKQQTVQCEGDVNSDIPRGNTCETDLYDDDCDDSVMDQVLMHYKGPESIDEEPVSMYTDQHYGQLENKEKKTKPKKLPQTIDEIFEIESENSENSLEEQRNQEKLKVRSKLQGEHCNRTMSVKKKQKPKVNNGQDRIMRIRPRFGTNATQCGIVASNKRDAKFKTDIHRLRSDKIIGRCLHDGRSACKQCKSVSQRASDRILSSDENTSPSKSILESLDDVPMMNLDTDIFNCSSSDNDSLGVAEINFTAVSKDNNGDDDSSDGLLCSMFSSASRTPNNSRKRSLLVTTKHSKISI